MSSLRVLSVISLMLITTTLYSQRLTIDSVMQKVAKGKPYVLCILKAGKPLPADEVLVTKLQSDHLVHLFQMEKDGKISIFGPVTNQESAIRGIIIFNTSKIEEAKSHLEFDPYIKEGYLKFELYNWFAIPGQTIPVK
jgi:uncharacterized protein YciI